MTPQVTSAPGKEAGGKDEWLSSRQVEIQGPVAYVGGSPAGSWVCESAGQEGAPSWGQRWGVIYLIQMCGSVWAMAESCLRGTVACWKECGLLVRPSGFELCLCL